MITITVTSDGQSGSLVATASANVMTLEESADIAVDNQTSSLLYVEQMIPETWVVVPAASYSPSYENLGAIGTGGTQPVAINNGGIPKAYLGFANGTDAALPDEATLFKNVPANDSWFFTAPAPGPIVPMRISGCIDVVLTPQTDPNPPHNVHPVAAITVNSWDPTNPMLWITDDSGAAVTLYVQVFYTAASAKPSDYFSYPLPTKLSAYIFPCTAADFLKVWYGFAFSPPAPGSYADAQAYFTDHPYSPDGGHHTGEIPPADSGS